MKQLVIKSSTSPSATSIRSLCEHWTEIHWFIMFPNCNHSWLVSHPIHILTIDHHRLSWIIIYYHRLTTALTIIIIYMIILSTYYPYIFHTPFINHVGTARYDPWVSTVPRSGRSPRTWTRSPGTTVGSVPAAPWGHSSSPKRRAWMPQIRADHKWKISRATMGFTNSTEKWIKII